MLESVNSHFSNKRHATAVHGLHHPASTLDLVLEAYAANALLLEPFQTSTAPPRSSAAISSAQGHGIQLNTDAWIASHLMRRPRFHQVQACCQGVALLASWWRQGSIDHPRGAGLHQEGSQASMEALTTCNMAASLATGATA